MFIAINRIQVPKDQGESLEKRFAASEGLKGQPGVLGFELLRRTWQRGSDAGAEEPEEYMAVTRWETEAQFHAWTQSDAFKKAHGGGSHAQHGHASLSHTTAEKAHACGKHQTSDAAEKSADASCASKKSAGMNAQATGYTLVLSKEPQLA